MPVDQLLALFRALRAVRFDLNDKPSIHENLIDILEIVAVAAGVKPAHLNGQGLHSPRLLRELSEIAHRHGLETAETQSIISYRHRAPRCDSAITQWKVEEERRERGSEPRVLWIYKDPDLLPILNHTGDGVIDVAQALGYPDCCVTHCGETKIALLEQYVEALQARFHGATPAELIRLIAADTPVQLSGNPFDDYRRTRMRFPYVQFDACPPCLEGTDSPAARVNAQMHDLARSLMFSFALEIERSATAEVQPQQANRLPKTGRNDPCPCGSGKKWKRCHGKG